MGKRIQKGVRLKIKRVKSKGKTYLYRPVRGNLVRLPDLPENHPDFLQAYIDAGSAIAGDGTLASLIEQFIASDSFKLRKASTRTMWRRRLDTMRELFGEAPAKKITVVHVERALSRLRPGAARTERTIWRALFSFAKSEHIVTENPAKHAEILKAKPSPHKSWTPEDIAAFRTHWQIGTPARQAFEVIYWTGARCVDAAVFGWQQVNPGGVLVYVQEKTGGKAYVPITATVAPFLEADRQLFLEAASTEMLFILSNRGRARSVKALSQLVSKAARDVGLEKKTAHGLRKARGVVLAENGWTPHQIGAWLGHESLQEVTHYTRDVNKAAMVVENRPGKPGKPERHVIDFKS